MDSSNKNQWKDETPAFLIMMNCINTITHLMLGAIMFYAFTYAAASSINIGSWSVGSSSFAAHVYLCVLGYIILLTQTMLVYNPYVGWATNLKYPQKKTLHIVLHVLGSTLAIIGTIVKMSDNARSLDSGHAVLGFIAMLLTMLSLIGAILNLVFSSKTENNSVFQVSLLCLGVLTLFFALVSLATAFGDYSIAGNRTASNLAITFTVFGMLGLFILIFMTYIRKYLKF